MFDLNNKLNIKRLSSGGIMTSYFCSSKCRHCLYGSSPKWSKDFIDKNLAENIFKKVKSMGCFRVHIGGGEPFLRIDILLNLLQKAQQIGIGIDYIETNSSWYKNEEECIQILEEIKSNGVDTLLISMSPFHNEFIPFYKVKGVIKACKKAGLNIFPWQRQFYNEINNFNDRKIHKLTEYREEYDSKYIEKLSSRFGLTMRGRSLKTYRDIFSGKQLKDILKDSSRCRELENTSHFHFDPYGNYIPGLCSGLAIEYQDLGKPLSSEKYPVLNILHNQGISGLYMLATKEYGYSPEKKYLSKCHLCFEIRKYLVLEEELTDLQPIEYYKHV